MQNLMEKLTECWITYIASGATSETPSSDDDTLLPVFFFMGVGTGGPQGPGPPALQQVVVNTLLSLTNLLVRTQYNETTILYHQEINIL